MTIRDIGPGPKGPNGLRRVRDRDEADKRGSTSSEPSVGRTDRVEISAAGKALSAKGSLLYEMLSAQTSERLGQIQDRIDSGAYDTPEMAEEVARRILASGDFQGSRGEPGLEE